jgi:DNA end-binding protein Ku
MAARAIWKGQIKIGTTKVPVKLYSAVTDKTIRFHLLDERSLMRVKQHMVDPDSGEEVAGEDIQKGYEVGPGRFVLLTDEELEGLQPKPSRDIEVTDFVPPEAISQQWYGRPYYLGPDGNVKEYFALATALESRNREGVAHWVMRNKIYLGALRSQDGYLMLVTLRPAEEVIAASDLPKPGGRTPTQNELKMARQLVDALEGEFDPTEYEDEYRARVEEFLERKAKGRKPKLQVVKSRRKTTALDDMLARSLEKLKKEKRAG